MIIVSEYPLDSIINSDVVAGGQGGNRPVTIFLGALKFLIANVKYYTNMSSPACQQVQR